MNNIWKLYIGGYAKRFLDDMKKAAPTPEIKGTFDDLITYSKQHIAPWDTPVWSMVIDRNALSNKNMHDLDVNLQISREDGFNQIINECITLPKVDWVPSRLLRDLLAIGFDAVERSLFWSSLDIHVVSRHIYDPRNPAAKFSTVCIRIDFTHPTWWDILTYNYYKSPCAISWARGTFIPDKKLVDEIDRM